MTMTWHEWLAGLALAIVYGLLAVLVLSVEPEPNIQDEADTVQSSERN